MKTPDNWSPVEGTFILHNMTSRDGRKAHALCNKALRPWGLRGTYDFFTLSQCQTGRGKRMYEICASCKDLSKG